MQQNAAMSKEFVQEFSEQSREFCIIGLTGKVRSGTSDISNLLSDARFHDLMEFPADDTDDVNDREYRIIYRFLRENWKPFVEIGVSSVMISYLLELQQDKLKSIYRHDQYESESVGGKIYDVLCECLNSSDLMTQVSSKAQYAKSVLLFKTGIEEQNDEFDKACENIEKRLSSNNQDELGNTYNALSELWNEVKGQLNNIDTISHIENAVEYFELFIFCFGVLPILDIQLKNKLVDDDIYPIAFQIIGNNIRATGGAASITKESQINAKNLFSLPSRINMFIKLLRKYPNNSHSVGNYHRTPVYVVINNFKNVFEAYYFKRRYSAFYLMSVSCNEEKRRNRFNAFKNYLITNMREDLSSGKRIYKSVIEAKRLNDSIDLSEKSEMSLCSIQNAIGGALDKDGAIMEFIQQIFYSPNTLLKTSYEKNLAPFLLQDVVTCIENADIFVTRDYNEPEYKYDKRLIRMIGRIAALILHPGLLVPTPVERCMQIAMTAKLNSGCLSRQVGAVVTDADYNILSLGWNDAPCGMESCLYRNFYDLARKSDKSAYSVYELYDVEFRRYIDCVKSELEPIKTELKGLPMAFCFKDIYQDLIKQRDQIYTRALHGEERALAACGNTKAKGGNLFTTSSPCELCAKRAKEAGISIIYYIEQYPGISRDHIISIGPKETRAKYVPFVGAVGLAYTKLYTPLIPYKDELAAVGFSPKEAYDRTQKRNLAD